MQIMIMEIENGWVVTSPSKVKHANSPQPQPMSHYCETLAEVADYIKTLAE